MDGNIMVSGKKPCGYGKKSFMDDTSIQTHVFAGYKNLAKP